MDKTTLDLIHHLMQRNYVSVRTYERAAEIESVGSHLTAYFQQQAERHREYYDALQQSLPAFEAGRIKTAFSADEPVPGTWPVSVMSDDDTCAILKNCTAAVTDLLPVYQEVIDHQVLPDNLRKTLDQEFQMCQQALASLKEKMAAIKQSTEADTFNEDR